MPTEQPLIPDGVIARLIKGSVSIARSENNRTFWAVDLPCDQVDDLIRELEEVKRQMLRSKEAD